MNTYSVKEYLRQVGAGRRQRDPSRYVFLWNPDLYRELFETAFLAASEGFPLPDHPIFKDLHQYGYFKAWFAEHWEHFAVPLNGLDVSDHTNVVKFEFDKRIWSRDEVIEYLQNHTENDEEIDRFWHKPPQPDFPLSKPDEEIKKQIEKLGVWTQTNNDDVGFLPVQNHFSRKRMAYMAFNYYDQLVEHGEIHKDLLKIYVAHQLGVFNITRVEGSKSYWADTLEMMLWKQEKKNGAIEKPTFKGHYVNKDWEKHIVRSKDKVTEWRIHCLHDFICLSKGVFPATDECLAELGVDKTKTDINYFEDFIREAEANRLSRDKKVNREYSEAFADQLEEFEEDYSVYFVKTRISTESIFEKIEFSEGHQFSKGWFSFTLSKKFCAAKNQIEWFASYFKDIHSLKKGERKYGNLIDAICGLLLNMKPYIESGAWGKTDENGKIAHQIHQFEISSHKGYQVAAILNSFLNK